MTSTKLFTFSLVILMIGSVSSCTVNSRGDVNFIFYSDQYPQRTTETYGRMITHKVQNEEIFKGHTIGNSYGLDCPYDSNDIRILIIPTEHRGAAGKNLIILNKKYKLNKFVIMHEIGHVYGLDHTEEPGTYMSEWGARSKFNEKQIKTIKSNL